MRKLVFLLGLFVVGVGLALLGLLTQLSSTFFRAYLPTWTLTSYVVIIIGIVTLCASVVLGPGTPDTISTGRAARLSAVLALVNGALACVFITPILYPGFRFPILITQWPGIYMVIAYLVFIIVGVLGEGVWAVFLGALPGILNVNTVSRIIFVVQATLSEVGIVGLAVSMFAGGYVGASLAYQGAGPVVVGAQMEFSVIPSAVFIFMVVAGTMAGILNVTWMIRQNKPGP